MNSSRLSAIGLLALCAMASAKVDTARGDDKSDAVAAIPVLRDEITSAVDRRERLSQALDRRPELLSARWHAGYVRDGEEWQPFEEYKRSAKEDERLRFYRDRRASAPWTAAGQLALADWCRKEGLLGQELAHLHAALSLGPVDDSEAVLRRMGYRRVGGEWLSPEQLREWALETKSAIASVKKWRARLERIRKASTESDRQSEATRRKLQSICTVSAIPALEYIFCGHDERSALLALEVFGGMRESKATVAIAKQAITSNWDSVRRRAAEHLRGRPLETFVPPLIALLSTPLQMSEIRGYLSQPEFVDVSGHLGPAVRLGTLYYSGLIARETSDQFQILALHTLNSAADDFLAASGATVFPRRPLAMLKEIAPRAERALIDHRYSREQAVERINERIKELNRRVALVLTAISGRMPSENARDWWNWWHEYTDTEPAGPKRVTIVHEFETIGELRPNFNVDMSCFAAGTPVWTETGLVPIEQIQIGDRVLAKDVDTGELTYKPVLQTSVRPPRELTTLRFADETIVCTGGHRFWASGSGWVKARDLAPQTLLHTATGSTPVWISKQGHSAETYNLVVADFHTYFVGNTALLCQDLLLPRPTDKVVPGLVRSDARR